MRRGSFLVRIRGRASAECRAIHRPERVRKFLREFGRRLLLVHCEVVTPGRRGRHTDRCRRRVHVEPRPVCFGDGSLSEVVRLELRLVGVCLVEVVYLVLRPFLAATQMEGALPGAAKN